MRANTENEMKINAIFKDGKCELRMFPDGEWEEKLLGAIAAGKETLSADVMYEPEGHFSYQRCKAVCVVLSPAPSVASED